MPRRRDPNLKTGHLCRFCGQLVPWGSILRLIRVDPEPQAQDCRGQSENGAQAFMLSESACHTDCLRGQLHPDVELTFHRHWSGRAPMLDDDADVDGKPCAMCAKDIAPPDLVRLRVQRPSGTVKAPEFEEQTLPLHFDCLAAVSSSKLF